MEPAASNSAEPTAFRLRWDVFLSFRGKDTRNNFVERLHDALSSMGVRVFRDNEGINKGDEIRQRLLDAIEDSAAAIVVFSPKYADSHWCLEELARLCDLRKLVLPVFYKVDPSDVRRHKGPFAKDMEDLEARFEQDEVASWKNAMASVGGRSGWVHGDWSEPELIDILVKKISNALSNSPMVVAPYIVGLDFPMSEVMELLDLTSRTPVVVALVGTGGIGKTTISKAVYNKLAGEFAHRSFVSNVRETFARPDGVLLLQNHLIKELSTNAVCPVDNESDGQKEVIRKLQQNRVLVVLDDIDNADQLSELGFSREWLSEGSRILITTRNRDALPTEMRSQVHEVRGLGSSDALKLFSYYALRREQPTEPFLKLSKEIVSITGGLPLALQVFGSFLFDKRREEEWHEALKKLQQIRPDVLQHVLKISFDALDDEVKTMFLDIACLLLNLDMTRMEIIDVMQGCGISAEIGMTTLIARSLIKVVEQDKLWMHDQIRDMGREIVVHESHGDIGSCSRIWDHGDVLEVLRDQKGTPKVQGMIFDFDDKNIPRIISARTIARNQLQTAPNFTAARIYLKEKLKECLNEANEVRLDTKSFESMKNLRLLQFGEVKLDGSFRYIPDSVRWLQWKSCSLKNLPSDFLPEELRVLDLSKSKIERVWERKWFWNRQKVANKLEVLNLHNCYNMTSTPDFTQHKCLQKLRLDRCTSLKSIHKSVGDLNALRHLNMMECPNLVDFPSDVSGLKSLEVLLLSGCSQLEKLPQNIGCMTSLRELSVGYTRIKELPRTIFFLENLEKLSVDGCKFLKRLPQCIGRLSALRELSLYNSAIDELPDSIGLLGNLEKLNLMWCTSLTSIPDSIGSLKSLSDLWLSGSSIEVVPASVGSLYYLKVLLAGNCRYLDALPPSMGGLFSLVEFEVSNAPITCLPNEIGFLKSLKKLVIRECVKLSSLPESIGNLLSLHTLVLAKSFVSELPESIGSLENLVMLNLNNCEKLSKLPDSIGNLKNLCHLKMEHTAITALPESFGNLSGLMILKMRKKPEDSVTSNRHVTCSDERKVLPSSFSKLSVLKEFHARAWKISGKIPDDFENLKLLEILDFSYNDFCSLPSNLTGLCVLKELLLTHCKELKSLPPLPSSLKILNATNCTSLETLSDISNLLNLEELYLTNCRRIADIQGVECLKSLKRLHMGGCSSHAAKVVKKLNKVALRKLLNLSIPGSEIPDCFTDQDEVLFSTKKNHAIKSVIVVAIISVIPKIPKSSTDVLPVIANFKANILRVNQAVFGTCLNFVGVPDTEDDQLYLCRYYQYHPLVSILEHGDKIKIETLLKPQFGEGVVMKKCGINLVYENDDDYEGEEDGLDEDLQTVSHKFKSFIGSSKEHVASTSSVKIGDGK